MIDDLLATAAKRGLALNNLFELHDGRWWAEFRDRQAGPGGYGSKSATRATAVEALEAALGRHQPTRAALFS